MKCCFFVVIVYVHIVESKFYHMSSAGERIRRSTSSYNLPWIGMLKYYDLKKEAVTNIILIAKNLALGNADQISTIDKHEIRKKTTVVFFTTENNTWDCFVTEYFIHPEFVKTKNTIALLRLETKSFVPNFMWQPINWPQKFFSQTFQSNVYSVGLKDGKRRKIVEQVVSEMQPLSKEVCRRFYEKENLNLNRLWPTRFNCFKSADDEKSCVYEAGMGLAFNSSGNWTLIGISTHGPGCRLPSRYIEFYPYIPWIKFTINRYYPEKSTITRHNPEKGLLTRRYNWLYEQGENQDSLLFSHLNDNFTVLYLDSVNIDDVVYGQCSNNSSIVYAESGTFTVDKIFNPTVVFFSVSLWDEKVKDYECIVTKVNCLRKSKTTVFIKKGFGQEDLEPFIKKVPISTPFDTDKNKVLYLVEGYKPYRKKETITIWFKFELADNANIDVKVYGIWKESHPPITSSTTPQPYRTYKTYPRRAYNS